MQSKKKKNEKPAAPLKSSVSVYATWLIKNVLLLSVAFLGVKYMFSAQPGYKWVYNDLLKSNMEFIRKYPGLTFEQKMEMKLGVSYKYLLLLKQATPENAVILYPSSQAFTKKGSPFTQEIYNKVYALRFLYPRKLVLEHEMEKSKYAGEITHIAIVNGEGKDRVPYPVDPAFDHGILPVDPQTKK